MYINDVFLSLQGIGLQLESLKGVHIKQFVNTNLCIRVYYWKQRTMRCWIFHNISENPIGINVGEVSSRQCVELIY